ncbi:MAG: type II secretion system protein GspM [bacterium]
MSRLTRMQQFFRQSAIGRWFYGREQNEQRVIAAISALVLVAVLWAGVWKPVADWRYVETNRHQNAQQLIDWLRVNEQAAKQAASSASSNRGSRALIPVITKAADAHNIRVSRLQPESNGVISVVLQQQSFNQIVQWIAQLDENNGVSIDRASFDSQDTPGYVNAQIRLN